MKKETKNSWILVIVILSILLIASLGTYYFTQMTAFYDGYLIEDDFSIVSPALSGERRDCQTTISGTITTHLCQDSNWITHTTGSGNTYYENNKLIIYGSAQSGSSGSAQATYRPNLKNKDIKTQFLVRGTGNIYVTFGDINVGTFAPSSSEYVVELIKDVTDENKFAVLVNSNPVKDIVIESNIAMLSFYAPETGIIIELRYIKSKPYFSCQVDNDEVVVRDRFAEGSTFDIHDLTYEPTKFCPEDYPAVVRDFRERGVKADIRGTITQNLTTGKSYTVPVNQAYEINYITKYKDGMGERCNPLTDVYDTSKKICVKKIDEQDYIIRDCGTNPEVCPTPNTCEKRDGIYVCVTTDERVLKQDCNTNKNMCDENYGEVCELKNNNYVCVRTKEIIELYRTKEFIQIGKNQKFFENNLIIGDKDIKSTKPSYSCDTSQNYNSPNPKSDCWKSSVSYAGKNIEMLNDGVINLDDCFPQLKLVTNAHYDSDMGEVDSFTNNIIIDINFDCISSNPIAKTDYYVIKDSKKQLCFNLNNRIANFDQSQSGFSIIKTTDLVTTQNALMMEKAINIGDNKACFDVDTSMYGEVTYQILPYFKLGNDIFFDDERIIYNYNIVDKVPEESVKIVVQEKIVNAEKVVESEELSGKELSSEKSYVMYYIIGSIVAVLLIILLIFILKKR